MGTWPTPGLPIISPPPSQPWAHKEHSGPQAGTPEDPTVNFPCRTRLAPTHEYSLVISNSGSHSTAAMPGLRAPGGVRCLLDGFRPSCPGGAAICLHQEQMLLWIWVSWAQGSPRPAPGTSIQLLQPRNAFLSTGTASRDHPHARPVLAPTAQEPGQTGGRAGTD